MVLGLTATFDRIDGRAEMLKVYCPVIDTIDINEAVKNKWVAPYLEYKVTIDVDLTEYNLAHQEFLNHFSFFDFSFSLAMDCVKMTGKRIWYAKQIGCDVAEVAAHAFGWNRAMRKRKDFVMKHPKKVEIAKLILENRKEKKAITFCATIKQAESLGIGYVIHSGKGKKKNRLSLKEFSLLKKGVVHTSKALNEGADVPGLNLAIILSNNSSKTTKTQRIGRVIRFEEGKEAEVFTLVIKGTNEESWFNNSTSGKKYIDLTEDELLKVLKGKNLPNKESKEVKAKKSDLTFRF